MNFTKPLNMPRSTHFGSNYYEFPSKKLNRVVRAFSSLEYWNQICLEMDVNVKTYCEQPYEADLFFDGKIEHTVFDVWVAYGDGTEEFQEVKTSEDLKNIDDTSQRCHRQIAHQKAWCAQNNINYQIKTDKEILLGSHYIRNLQYLYYKILRMDELDPIAENYITHALSEKGLTTIGLLINNGIVSKNNAMLLVADLYYKGSIGIENLNNKPISLLTGVYINGK